jgi:type IV pilus assembly protein PilZ
MVLAVSDKRGSERLPVDVKVDYRTVGSFITDYTKDLSKGGIFIKTSLPLEVGTRVRLRLTLPDGDAPFALDGVVKWVSTLRERDKHPAGMGVEFVDFDEDVKTKIEALVMAYRTKGEA